MNTTIIIQAIVSGILAVLFTVLIVLSQNPNVITASIAGLVGIYAHWLPSPIQTLQLVSLVRPPNTAHETDTTKGVEL